MELEENNRKVIINLYRDGYKVREISQLTNNSVFKILKYLNMKKA